MGKTSEGNPRREDCDELSEARKAYLDAYKRGEVEPLDSLKFATRKLILVAVCPTVQPTREDIEWARRELALSTTGSDEKAQ